VVIARAQEGAEALLGAAGLSAENMSRVVDTIVVSSGGESKSSEPASAAPANPPAPAAALATPLREPVDTPETPAADESTPDEPS
jgi:hypothetical protein